MLSSLGRNDEEHRRGPVHTICNVLVLMLLADCIQYQIFFFANRSYHLVFVVVRFSIPYLVMGTQGLTGLFDRLRIDPGRKLCVVGHGVDDSVSVLRVDDCEYGIEYKLFVESKEWNDV